MGAVTEYIVDLVVRQVQEHNLVVWFDPERHYADLVGQMSLPDIQIACYRGSFFALRHEVEPLMQGLEPPRLLIYVPLAEEDTCNALVELTAAGVVLKPGQSPWQRNTRLSVLARRALKPGVGEGTAAAVERQVEAGKLSLVDLDNIAAKGQGVATGVVAAVFGTDNLQEITLAFLASDSRDADLMAKGAVGELASLIAAAYDLDLPSTVSPEQLRASLARQVLATDFLAGLAGTLPEVLGSLKIAREEQARAACLTLARTWRSRRDLAESYVVWAGLVEQELGLVAVHFSPWQVRDTETFLAVEQALQAEVEAALLSSPTPEAVEIARFRQAGFWAGQVPEVQAHWYLIDAAGKLLLYAARLREELQLVARDAGTMLLRYTKGEQPWCLLDTLHRRLEQRYQNYDFTTGTSDQLEALITRARQQYMDVAGQLAVEFEEALAAGKFQFPHVLLQTEVYQARVAPAVGRGKTAYILADALRFEMARELGRTLAVDFDVEIQAAAASIPGITEIGMAALMPHDGELALVAEKGKLALETSGILLKDHQSRVKFFQARAGVPAAHVKITDLLPRPKKRVREVLANVSLVLVTSQEIDRLGEEADPGLFWRLQEDQLTQIRRACHVLAELGVMTIILAADHGFLLNEELASSMKIDQPGGETADLHRRVWVGRGGSTGTGYIRTTAAALGWKGDLEIAVPLGLGGFKVKGGATAYFHGGLTLPEIVIPVVTLIPKKKPLPLAENIVWKLAPGSKKLSTRFFSVQVSGRIEGLFPAPPPLVKVEIRAGREVISRPVSASYGFQEGTGEVQVRLSETDKNVLAPNTVALMLVKEPRARVVAIYLVEAASWRELARLEPVEVAISI